MAEYSALDRMLHRLALQYPPIAELSFDFDQKAVDRSAPDVRDRRHVFISGLARAGTTVLMRRFHASGMFRSLTYRDMPFVLAPNLWKKLNSVSKRESVYAERAHGDRVLVSADSPESLDEPFWRVFAGSSYILPDALVPHDPDPDVSEKYAAYVRAILASDDGGADRYLSKNNNNILRQKALRQIFPRALLLTPFRAPRTHAESLLRQHVQFNAMQGDDVFVRRYMTWLGHHEFGADHRPFRFDAGRRQPGGAPETLEYWLGLWRDVYAWLERSQPDAALFVCYEDLCGDIAVWRRLAELADIPPQSDRSEAFDVSTTVGREVEDKALLDECDAIYDRLRARARRQLEG